MPRLQPGTRSVLRACAALEACTGLGLLVLPRLVVRLLFGADLTGSGVITARVCGLALLSLGCACWPETAASPDRPDRRAARALLLYNGLASVYFLYLWALAGYRGIALVPAIVVHAVLALLLARQGLWYRVPAG